MLSKKKKCGGVPTVKDCANCGSSEGSIPGTPVHRFCSGCQITFYCNRKCQKAHWKSGGHKQVCLKPENRKASEQPEPKDLHVKGEKCCICLEEMTKEGIIKLDCGHTFHLACIQQLQEKPVQKVCPLCRADSLPDRPKIVSSDNYPRSIPNPNQSRLSYDLIQDRHPINLMERSIARLDWDRNIDRVDWASLSQSPIVINIDRVDWASLSQSTLSVLLQQNIERVNWNIFINSSVAVTSRLERDIDEQNIVRGDLARNGESR